MLVALRLWAPQWQANRVRLEVRADNVSALTLVATMRGRGWALVTIAREIALDFAKAACRPAVCAHVPGVGLELADRLSRRYQPSTTWQPPQKLVASAEATAPARPRAWYRSLGPPKVGP